MDGNNRTLRVRLSDRIYRLVLLLSRLGRPKFQGGAEQFFEHYHDERHVDWAKYDFRVILRAQTARAIVAQMVDSGERVIDIGCGVGDLLGALPDAYQRIGVGYAENDLRLALSVAGQGVDLVRGSAIAIPLASGVARLVFCVGVLEYLEDDEGALVEMRRILAPGSWMVLDVANGVYYPEYRATIGHLRTYTRSDLDDKLKRAGFRIVHEVETYRRLSATHFLGYAQLLAVHRLLDACGWHSRSLYIRPGIGQVYRAFSAMLMHLKSNELWESNPDEQSTFVVAQRTD